MTMRDDTFTARDVLRARAFELKLELSDAIIRKTGPAVEARRAAWRDLAARGWKTSRIARAFGMHHQTVHAALQGCPMCGEPFERVTAAPHVQCCGVATSMAWHHAGHMCVKQTAFALVNEDNRGEVR